MSVTDGFGQAPLGRDVSMRAPGAETAMRQLQREHSVKTRYDGRFVQSIDGREGGTQQGRPVDWFYFVNGEEAKVGAAEQVLHRGDSVWWVRRDWGAATHVPAVVGQWPHPFVEKERQAGRVQLDCIGEGGGSDEPCDRVRAALERIGAEATTGPGTAGSARLRVVVGEWRSIRSSADVAQLESGPGTSGVYVVPERTGTSLSVLDPAGRTAARLRAGTGLVAATAATGGGVVWIVSGLGQAGVSAAAKALNTKALNHRYALVVRSDGVTLAAPQVSR